MVVKADEGFSLLEVLMATAVMLAMMAGVFGAIRPAYAIFSRELEVADVQQRLRVASDTLMRDLIMAGGGSYSGERTGMLAGYFAAVLPFRAGVINPDPPGTFQSRTITVLYVPSTPSQATIGQPLIDASADVLVSWAPGCPQNGASCGFQPGMTVVCYDESGAFDEFVVTSAQGDRVQLRHSGNALSKVYAAGTKIVQISSHSYFFDQSTAQLMHYDGGVGNDTPVVDHLVGLEFGYYGDPAPPRLKKKVTDLVGPWTTYGPKPKPPGVASGTLWPPGENCVFMSDPAQDPSDEPLQVPRLAELGGSATLARLAEAQLTDGPWCPDASAPNRFDADLLRIRKIAVTVRIEAASSLLRGPAGALFANGGSSRAASRWVPDQEARFEVSPRNLNLGR